MSQHLEISADIKTANNTDPWLYSTQQNKTKEAIPASPKRLLFSFIYCGMAQQETTNK